MNTPYNIKEAHDSVSGKKLNEIVIPKERAVFWMDEHGNWNNEHGRFENRRIIKKFNTSICKDVKRQKN